MRSCFHAFLEKQQNMRHSSFTRAGGWKRYFNKSKRGRGGGELFVEDENEKRGRRRRGKKSMRGPWMTKLPNMGKVRLYRL